MAPYSDRKSWKLALVPASLQCPGSRRSLEKLRLSRCFGSLVSSESESLRWFDRMLLQERPPATSRSPRRAQRFQPPHDIPGSHIPHLRILSILCQRGVALDHRNQKTGSLVRIQITANGSLGLSSAQKRGDSVLPRKEQPFKSLAELFVQRRHLLRHIEQRTTFSNVRRPSWQPPDNAHQNVDGIPVA